MNQRVAAIKGELPAIIVIPHGRDDTNTTIIGEHIVKELDCYGVINYGWRRADQYDYYKDHANCNNIEHCQQDVVREEFLEPIVDFTRRIEKDFPVANIFIIHGVSNSVSNGRDGYVDVIMGHGNGKIPSFSCEKWVKDAFGVLMTSEGLNVYEGKSGGAYAGHNKKNLNQLFTQWIDYQDETVQSMQLEIVKELRKNEDTAKLTALTLSACIQDLMGMELKWDKWSDHEFGISFPKI